MLIAALIASAAVSSIAGNARPIIIPAALARMNTAIAISIALSGKSTMRRHSGLAVAPPSIACSNSPSPTFGTVSAGNERPVQAAKAGNGRWPLGQRQFRRRLAVTLGLEQPALTI